MPIPIPDDRAHPVTHTSNTGEIARFILARQASVLTFTGYSGAGYEDERAMLNEAASVLAAFRPETTLVNIGATAEGIGAVYELAKAGGFQTIGIVSSLARDENLTLSAYVDHVFFIQDSTWGGCLPGTSVLSPTSAAIVANSSSMVGIGGGEIARDEMLAARQAGKPVHFVPAQMNHRLAREKAGRNGLPAPSDFNGAAHAAFAGIPALDMPLPADAQRIKG